MFTPLERDRVRDHVLEIARGDDRVVAAALVGSLAHDDGDRWSDIDLSFAVRDDVSVSDVLDDWTTTVTEDLGAVHLFDLVVALIQYRVFLLPECLQLDLSFSPASVFRPTSSRFRLLYGQAGEPIDPDPPSADELLGWAVLYARDTRVSIERGDIWRAERSLSELRSYALSFACSLRGLPASYGKAHDRLPARVLASFTGSLASTVEPRELARALRGAVAALRTECANTPGVPPKLDDYLGDVVAAPWELDEGP
ncbi:MAG: nucleotidyltransferase domain-containing protein [Actinomycetota bacterium]|nr:nucleotidyltransferase domain-containing protein [Actinomycetota bacterium]